MQETQETQVWSLCQEAPPEKETQPTSVSLPVMVHGLRSLMGYSPWGPKRVRQDLATKQQGLTNADCIQSFQLFYARPFPVLGRHPGATLHSVTTAPCPSGCGCFLGPSLFSTDWWCEQDQPGTVQTTPQFRFVWQDFPDWTGAVGSGKREVLFLSHRIGGLYHQHDLLLMILTLITWLTWDPRISPL